MSSLNIHSLVLMVLKQIKNISIGFIENFLYVGSHSSTMTHYGQPENSRISPPPVHMCMMGASNLIHKSVFKRIA